MISARGAKKESVPRRKLSTDFDAAVLDALLALGGEARAHDGIDNGAGGAVADHATRREIRVCTACQVVRVTVEDSVRADNIRSERGEEVQLIVLDEGIVRRRCRHLELAVPNTVWVSECHTEFSRESLPEAAEVDLMCPDAGVQLTRGELLVHDKADVTEELYARPAGVTAKHADADADKNPTEGSQKV